MKNYIRKKTRFFKKNTRNQRPLLQLPHHTWPGLQRFSGRLLPMPPPDKPVIFTFKDRLSYS